MLIHHGDFMKCPGKHIPAISIWMSLFLEGRRICCWQDLVCVHVTFLNSFLGRVSKFKFNKDMWRFPQFNWICADRALKCPDWSGTYDTCSFQSSNKSENFIDQIRRNMLLKTLCLINHQWLPRHGFSFVDFLLSYNIFHAQRYHVLWLVN